MAKFYVPIVAAIAAALALYVFHIKLSEIIVPGNDTGMESSSLSISGLGPDKTRTALGQVFKVPARHSVLTNARFLVWYPQYRGRPSSSLGVSSRMRIKLRISVWNGSKIVGDQLFESATLVLPKVESSAKPEWISFPIQNLQLMPGNTYLAWITGVDLANEPYDAFSIVRMGSYRLEGSTEWKSMYLDGYFVAWDNDTTEGSLTRMYEEPWKPDERRTDLHPASLHFKLTFRSRRPFFLCLRPAWC